jgi:hypothetical protein
MKTTTLTKMIMAVAVVASSFTSCKKDKTPDLIKRTTATLSGAQEVPANSSTGTGTAQISYDPTAKTITYTMSWQLGSSTATTANMHFHGAEDGTDIKSSPVTIGITGFATGSSGTITGTTRALTDAEANQLLAGKWYLNVHSSTIPGGELRGNIKF